MPDPKNGKDFQQLPPVSPGFMNRVEQLINRLYTFYKPTTLSVYQIACRAGQHDHRKYHRPHSEHRAFDIQIATGRDKTDDLAGNQDLKAMDI